MSKGTLTRLKRKRLELKSKDAWWTQRNAATVLNVGSRSFAGWEADAVTPILAHRRKIERFLEIDNYRLISSRSIEEGRDE